MSFSWQALLCGAMVSVLCVACSTPKPSPDTTVADEPSTEAPVSQPLTQTPDEPAGEAFVVKGVRAAGEGMTLDAKPQRLFGLWSVSSGSPDYIYMFGQGEASGDAFTMTFDGPPPAEAINSYGVGVAVIGGLASESTPLASGRCEEDCLGFPGRQAKMGVPFADAFADRYAVIWVDASKDFSNPKLPDWMRNAPKGYSCVKGVPSTNDGFDGFEQVDCAQVVLRVDMKFEFVNWT
jgi:hypothetical protein